jgi:hypothetical protein
MLYIIQYLIIPYNPYLKSSFKQASAIPTFTAIFIFPRG